MGHRPLLNLAIAALFAGGSLAARADGEKKHHKNHRERGDSGGSWHGPYGMAGCGWGGYSVGTNPNWLAQWGAAELNGICTNQSSGITSGTSNCDKAPPELAQTEQEVFVTSNLASLRRESAQGDGEHLAAFAELLGCSDDYPAFAGFTQRNHAALFSPDEPREVLQRLKNALSSEPGISCRRA